MWPDKPLTPLQCFNKNSSSKNAPQLICVFDGQWYTIFVSTEIISAAGIWHELNNCSVNEYINKSLNYPTRKRSSMFPLLSLHLVKKQRLGIMGYCCFVNVGLLEDRIKYGKASEDI